MTKLQYLRARNRNKLPFGQLPADVQFTLKTIPRTVNEWYPGYTAWRDIVPVFRDRTGLGLFSDYRIFRIPKEHRPLGIPEDIHRRYL